jgi:hypothetical protein
MEDEINGIYDDDGNKIEYVEYRGLCLTCNKKDDPGEEILCKLNLADQVDQEEFICYAYEKIDF